MNYCKYFHLKSFFFFSHFKQYISLSFNRQIKNEQVSELLKHSNDFKPELIVCLTQIYESHYKLGTNCLKTTCFQRDWPLPRREGILERSSFPCLNVNPENILTWLHTINTGTGRSCFVEVKHVLGLTFPVFGTHCTPLPSPLASYLGATLEAAGTGVWSTALACASHLNCPADLQTPTKYFWLKLQVRSLFSGLKYGQGIFSLYKRLQS